ncbi:putative SMC2orf [Dioszegia hungarica]|uniref:SMC2orf n=1 Tax=Dioszegia hungarica TaxID=4972 RepID=A0AA38HEE5_9TREE|nr:putative SMC2orf [Dioszegia hungarica]KAI9638811.1 putative SMC2orf [Dioszegia hungarica]
MAPKRPPSAGPSQPKRTRFAAAPAISSPSLSADESASLLEADLPEGGQRAKQRSRRQLKDKDGYGSDSSNEDGEGVVPSRNKPEVAEDEDMDMFGEDVDAPKEVDKKGKGKEKEFMELNEIEGQEFEVTGEDGMGDDDEDEEEIHTQRRKAGLDGDMGFELTGFNMKAEMEEGKFTADGESYLVNDKDEGEKHDVWLDAVDDEEIKKARRAHKERERVEEERQAKEDGEGRKEEERALMREAVGWMERGETVLECMERLGREAEEKRRKEEVGEGGKKKSWAEKQKERKAAAAAGVKDQATPFARFSEIVSALTTIGHLDVYSLSKEAMQRMLPADPASAQQSAPPPARDTRAFQYRFSMAYVRALPEAQRPVEREVFGPFAAEQLRQWRNTGFFGGPACENVELRVVKPDGSAGGWGSWESVVTPV